MAASIVVSHQGESYMVEEGDEILDAERVGAVWHVVRLTAAGDLDIRVFYSAGHGQHLWIPSTTKGMSFQAERVHAGLVGAIGTEAEKQAWLDSTDVPTCHVIETPWNKNTGRDDKRHTSSLPSLDGDPDRCLHCSLVDLAEFTPLVDHDFADRMKRLGIPAVYLDEPYLHLNVLASRPDWLESAFRGHFDESVYLQHREQVLADALALSLDYGAHRKPTKKK